MSVILLEPPRPKNKERFEDVVNAPLSSCLFTGYIAAVLKKHTINADIINAHLHNWSFEQTIANISKKNYSLLCVHVVYLWNDTKNIFDMLSFLKLNNHCTHINLYGYYPTFAYKELLPKYHFIDSVTVGEPEFTVTELAKSVLAENTPLLSKNITGLAFREENGNIVFCPRSPIQNLDTLPFPERYDIDVYRQKDIATYILGSRGCYGHCTFCYLNPFYGQANTWRGRSANSIFEEIYTLNKKFSLNNFYFSDANFFGPGKHGMERATTFADLILANDLNIRFGFECRVNDIEEKTIAKLVMAGLTNVFLGLESGDNNSLKRFKKHTTSEENKKAIHLLRNYGIEPTFGFIMFEPHSTLQSIRNNFEFLKETGIMTSPAVTAHLLHHRQTIFQGTPEYRSVMHSQLQADNSFSPYEVVYTINDAFANAFSTIITNICKDILSLLPQIVECDTMLPDLYLHSPILKELNSTLINAVDDILREFENTSIVPNSDCLHSTHTEIINNVKLLLLNTHSLHETKKT
ncbi:MAG: radical SAM protein [Candidatus Kuenenia sp.]|nr:radical SAM protein [Candidatus Kuenenia hertensis]